MTVAQVVWLLISVSILKATAWRSILRQFNSPATAALQSEQHQIQPTKQRSDSSYSLEIVFYGTLAASVF